MISQQKNIKCSCCQLNKSIKDIAYLKPEMIGTDYFPEVGTICVKCARNRIDTLSDEIKAPRLRKDDFKWLLKHAFDIYPLEGMKESVEELVFLCGIMIDEKWLE